MDFTSETQDVFRELGSIGSGNAITALSAMLGTSVEMLMPRCERVAFANIADAFGGPESTVAGVLVQMSGGLDGFVMMVQNLDDAIEMTQTLIGAIIEPDVLADPEQCRIALSPLEELGNILIGAYLGAISSMTNLELSPSVPMLSIDMAMAIMDVPALVYGEIGESVLVLETEFICAVGSIKGHCFLIPSTQSYTKLMQLLKV